MACSPGSLINGCRRCREKGIPGAPSPFHSVPLLGSDAGLQHSTRVVYLRDARYLLVVWFPDNGDDCKSVKAEKFGNFVCNQVELRRGAKQPGTSEVA